MSTDKPNDYLDKYRVPGLPEVFYIPDFLTEHEEEFLLRKINDAPQPKWKNLANRRYIIGGDVSKKNVLIAQQLPDFLCQFPDIIGRLRQTGAFDDAKHGEPNHVIINEYLAGQGIMPHEDGPAYHPVVATISLGSHAVFNYYRYLSDDPSITASVASAMLSSKDAAEGRGRPINPNPVLSLLLEPRSLVITRSSLYTGHLHGIEERKEDVFAPAPAPEEQQENRDPAAEGEIGAVRVANWQTAQNEVARTGGTLVRDTRVSLTCRDVDRVLDARRVGR
ncbi:hypothetical protein BKA62DRAFT_742451 [Auriculariales sp. MPI-PUGE-AT-0066]|nr:hypothetical protein BKA62DRAFT_742451 [Auriculariales sp. MPI-PUGE-AT-0066]